MKYESNPTREPQKNEKQHRHDRSKTTRALKIFFNVFARRARHLSTESYEFQQNIILRAFCRITNGDLAKFKRTNYYENSGNADFKHSPSLSPPSPPAVV